MICDRGIPSGFVGIGGSDSSSAHFCILYSRIKTEGNENYLWLLKAFSESNHITHSCKNGIIISEGRSKNPFLSIECDENLHIIIFDMLDFFLSWGSSTKKPCERRNYAAETFCLSFPGSCYLPLS
jgi:hypothetical protein